MQRRLQPQKTTQPLVKFCMARINFSRVDNEIHVHLSDIPGGPDAFELAAKLCYGVRLELTATNAVDFGQENLIARTKGFLNQVVLQN
ncbi:hypothetical protein GOP47_0003629 [Adiantum capillus-veneris]|uniref:Uncharacterized protein n=1 Tax=Adiantum capillus-veneris TaxID=13818 RepID=A0A9D4V5Z6_ADICA|nr:hypothetical protein GOP47_0003629 [Adiantum capillus-veneris]